MQKHNEWVDKIKDQWAHEHRLTLIRIWEHEINETPSEVMKMLREKIGEEEEKQQRRNNKAKRH